MHRETITLTRTEQQRGQVLARVAAGLLTAKVAATLLGLSVRHIRRLIAEVRKKGLAALAHGNRGQQSRRRCAETVRARVLTLARTRYRGCNDCHFTELLAEREDIHLSRPTVYRLLREAGMRSPRTRRPPRHRRRRERMPHAGLLVQLDGSHHLWLEDRGPRLVLLAAIDDATGRVLGALFRLQEDTHGYFLLLRHLCRHYGLPAAVYTDQHGIFRPDPRTPLTLEEQLRGSPRETQVGRALQELGVKWIGAHSPQAKGRIERLFGTFQDRLVIELRLAQASTLPMATHVLARFLPRYNARFAQAPAHPEPAWRPAPARAALDQICCFKYRRTVQHDNTVQLEGRFLQLAPGPGGRSFAGLRVDLHAHLNGTLAIFYRGQRIGAKRLPRTHRPPQCLKDRFSLPSPTLDTPCSPHDKPPIREPHIPPPNHPWRRTVFTAARRRYLQAQTVTDSLST
jgi:transposase